MNHVGHWLLRAQIVLCLAGGGGGALTAADLAPELILHNGKIVTVDERFSIHEALAVGGGRIVRTGRDEEILALKNPATKLVDLQGRMVLPGLMDSHMHPVSASVTEFDHPIPSMESVGDVLDYFRSRARSVPEGKWLMLQQVFITRLREQRYPTRAELDQAAPQHPVVFRTGPDASFNSLALKLAGIDRNFKIPAGVPGRVEKDDQGEPTGILRTFSEYVKLPAEARMAPASREDRLRRLAELLRDYRDSGLTMVCDRNASLEIIGLYQELRERGKLPVRVSLSQAINAQSPIDEVRQNIRQTAESPLFLERGDWLRIIGVKVFLDGGMLTGSAYMREPWGVSDIYAITDPTYRGTLFIPPDRLALMVRAAVESGLQFTAHTVGDGAAHALLDAYDAVNRDVPVRSSRPCISHANFMSREAVDAMTRLGVALDVQPAWLYLDTRTLAQHFGYERLRWFQPLRSIFEAGGMAGGGSDHMQKIGANRSINPYNPFLGIATAVTRRARWYEGRLHAEEALSREQAIRFYTLNNAWILFQDHKLGSLEAGKLADFIVVDRDLLSCPEEKIADTRVLQTYIDGKLVFSRE